MEDSKRYYTDVLYPADTKTAPIEDLKAARELIRSIYLEGENNEPHLKEFDKGFPDTETGDSLRSFLDHPIYGILYLARRVTNREIIGVMAAEPLEDSPITDQLDVKDGFHLAWARIIKEFEGKGILDRLFSEFLSDAYQVAEQQTDDGIISLTVNIHRLNQFEKLHKVLEGFGFEDIGKIDGSNPAFYENLHFMKRLVVAK